MDHDAGALIAVVPAELVPRDDNGHVLVGDRLEVLVQLNKAVGGDGEHDDQRNHGPHDLDLVISVDLRRNVACGLFRAAVPEYDPEQGRLDADEDDDGGNRDSDVGIEDVLAVGRHGGGEDGGDAAQSLAGVQQEGGGHET